MVQPDAQSKIAELTQEYDQIGHEVRETLGRLHPDDMNRKSGNEGWTVGNVARHIAKSPGGVVRYTKNIREGKSLNYPRFMIDAFNWVQARIDRTDLERLLPIYIEGHAQFAAEIESSAGDDWTRKSKVLGQEIDLEGWFRMNMAHERDHLAELKAGLP
jgi:DinB superfamily